MLPIKLNGPVRVFNLELSYTVTGKRQGLSLADRVLFETR